LYKSSQKADGQEKTALKERFFKGASD